MRVGVSGWSYAPWRGVFYPAGLRQKDEFRYVSSKLPTVEINGTFYSLQRAESFERWAAQTSDGFIFAVKGSGYITHMLRLNDIILEPLLR